MAKTVNANPTKEFFISMLTRDIDIKVAILELIDNSIDGAKRLRLSGDFNGLYINMSTIKTVLKYKITAVVWVLTLPRSMLLDLGALRKGPKKTKEDNSQVFLELA